MGEDYDGTYAQADYFGAGPSPLLGKFAEWIPDGGYAGLALAAG